MLSETFVHRASQAFVPFLLIAIGLGLGLAVRRPGSRFERLARAIGTPFLAFVFLTTLGEVARRLPASWGLAMGVALVPPTSRVQAAERLRAQLFAEPKDVARARTILALDAVIERCERSTEDALRLHLADEASRIAERCGTHSVAARAHYEEGDFERATAEYREARKKAPEAPLELTELTAALVSGHHEEASRLLREGANREGFITKASFVCLANAIDTKVARPGATLPKSPTDDQCNLLAEWFSTTRADGPGVANLERTLPRCDDAWSTGERGIFGHGRPPVELPASAARVSLDPFVTMDERTDEEGWNAPVLQSFGAISESHRARGRWLSLLGLHEAALAQFDRGLASIGPRAADPSLEALGAEVRALEPDSVKRLPSCQTAVRVPATSPLAARVRAIPGAASPYFEAEAWSNVRAGLILERARALARDFRVADARRALAQLPSGGGPDVRTDVLDLRETFAKAAARKLSAHRDEELEALVATGNGKVIAEALIKRKSSGVGIIDVVGRSLPEGREALVPFVAYEAKLECGSCGVYSLLRSLGDHGRMAAAVGDTSTMARTSAARDRILRTNQVGLHQDPDWALILHVVDRMFAAREWERGLH